MVPYKVDMGSDGNMMPLCIYKKSFTRATVQQLAATRDTNIKLKYVQPTTITQLGICRVKLEHDSEHKVCSFIVVPDNGQVLLGMPNIEILNILTINCNTLGTEEADKDVTCSTNTPDTHDKSTMQIQDQKLASKKESVQAKTEIKTAIQTK